MSQYCALDRIRAMTSQDYCDRLSRFGVHSAVMTEDYSAAGSISRYQSSPKDRKRIGEALRRLLPQ